MTIHPNIRRTWLEWEVENEVPKALLVIETDIELKPGPDGIDSSSLNEAMDAAVRAYDAPNITIARVRFVPPVG